MDMEIKKPASRTQSFATSHFKEAEIQDAIASADRAALFLTRFPHLLKHDGLFAMLDGRGDIGALMYNDTSYHASRMFVNAGLRGGQLTERVALTPVAATYDDARRSWRFVTENEAFRTSDGAEIPARALSFESTVLIWNQTLFRKLNIHNRSADAVSLTIDFACDAAMTDIFDMRGEIQMAWGAFKPARYDANTVLNVYTALDGLHQAARLRFAPPPVRLDNRHAHFALRLDGGAATDLFMEVQAFEAGASPIPLDVTRRSPERMQAFATQKLAAEVEARIGGQAMLTTNNDALNRILERSAYDIAMLATPLAEGPFPMAGLPWFNAVFGRDSLITARLELWRNPDLARGVLRYLAANQATAVDVKAAAQPGKIAHEIRLCEMARTGQVPYRRYYGSVDAPMLFIMLADAYAERTADRETIAQLWPHILAALDWMRGDADVMRDDLIRYARATKEDLANQGWEDSGDSVHHADGSLAGGAIALIEVQGYGVAARTGAARLARLLGHDGEAMRLDSEAAILRDAIDSRFWSDTLAMYGMAVDARGLCETLDSNIGQLLLARAVNAERGEAIAAALREERFFSGWGLRTKPAGGPRYDPTSYHNGSVWPHANALIGLGLVDYGHAEQAAAVLGALIDAAGYFNDRCPELFSGASRQTGAAPEPYANANPVQAWSAAAIPGMAAALLGLAIDHEAKCAVFHRPYLPDYFSGAVVLQKLQIGDGSVSVRLEGQGYDVRLSVMGRDNGADARLETAPLRIGLMKKTA